MPGIIQLQQQRSPWEQMLPGFVQNLMFNKMAEKRADKLLAAQTVAAQGKEARSYKAKGWRETGTHAGAIKIGDKYLVPPERSIEYKVKTIGGKQALVPVETMTPIGGKPQFVKAGTPITSEQKDPKTAMAAFLQQNPGATPQQIALFQQSLHKPNKFSLKMGPDGRLMSVSYGGVEGAQPLTKTNLTKVQQEVMSNDDQISQVRDIMDTYKSDYTDKWFRLGKSFDEFKENWRVGKPLTGTESKELGEYSIWRQNTAKNAVEVFHKFAGANMTKTEIKKVAPSLPIAGDKWHQGDSHSVFTSKLANMYKTMNLTNARKKYLLKQGYGQKEIEGMLSKDQMMTLTNFQQKADDAAIAKRNQLTQQAKQSGADLNDPKVMKSITNAVMSFLNDEFGFGFQMGQ